MKKALIALSFLLVTACASGPKLSEPEKVIVYVDRPVAVSCVDKDAPKKPKFTDTKEALKAAPNADIRYQLLSGNWSLKEAWMSAQDKIIANCASPK